MEESAKKKSTDYSSAMMGPVLDSLPSAMVDSGNCDPNRISSQASFNSSKAGSSGSRRWSTSSTAKEGGRSSRKLFQFGKRKAKEKPVSE